jgi:ubiquinone/menaquinone biosynthesis C-methylase UbiE
MLNMLSLIARQNIGRQLLERKPEPQAITDASDNVTQYDRVMETKLAISYAVAIDTIYKARPQPFGGQALDICCGPGHFSITLARELKLNRLAGVDLSAPMVSVASQNAVQKKMEHLSFQTGDATELVDFGDEEFDLTTMMDAAHHMPTLELVNKVIGEMDRVTKADGLVVLMDLVRLRTKSLTDEYVHLLAYDYVERGLPSFLDDFRNSMFAAWTPKELASTVPAHSRRQWSLVVPRGLPFAQFLIGYPQGRRSVFVKRKPLWKSDQIPVSPQNLADYRMAKLTMTGASIRHL